MQITNSTGIMNLDDDAMPTDDDKNDIIASLTRDDDDEEEFQQLCDASTEWEDTLTNAEFHAACTLWADNNL